MSLKTLRTCIITLIVVCVCGAVAFGVRETIIEIREPAAKLKLVSETVNADATGDMLFEQMEATDYHRGQFEREKSIAPFKRQTADTDFEPVPERRETLPLLRAGKHSDVIVGTGNLDLPAFLEVLRKNAFSGFFTLEYEGDVNDPVPATKDCVEAIRQAVETL